MVGARISNPQLFISPVHDGIQKRSSQTLCPSGYSFKPPTTSYITSFLIVYIYRREASFAKLLRQQLWIGFLLEEYYFVYICLFT